MDDHIARVRDLEKEFAELKAANAALTASVTHLTNSVDALTQTVGTLRDVMNQGRGALWFGMFMAGSVGALAMMIIRHVFFGGSNGP